MLTQDQIDHYHDQGYVLVGGIFDDDELDRMEPAFDAIIERRLARGTDLDITWTGDWNKPFGSMQTLLTHDVQAYSAQWARVLLHERFTATMADLIGPNVQLHHTKLFQKPPETGGAFPMHQDCPYFPHEKHSMMACTIHLTDTDEQMGCLRVWPGSHKLGPLPVHKEPHGGSQYQYLDPAEYPIDRATACPAQRGDVLFFSYLTIHGSDLNRSDRVRKTVLVQVRDAADRPLEDTHRSHSQGLMLHGINPLVGGDTAEATLDDPATEVDAR